MRVVLLCFSDASKGVVLLEVVGVELDWGLGESLLFPLVWAQVARGLGNSLEGGLREVSKSGSATLGRGVHVSVTSVGQDLLWHWGGDDTGTTWGWDESHMDGSALGVDLAWHGVWLSELGTPVASSDWDNAELGEDDGRADGVRDFFRALDSESNVSVAIADNNGSLESGSLTGSGLLLDGLDLEDLVLELGSEKVLDDFGLLDWEREGVNLA